MARGLTIVVAEPVAARLRSALTMALAARALAQPARIFLDAAAVALLAAPLDAAGGDAPVDRTAADRAGTDAGGAADAGPPSLAGLLDEAFAAEVALILCQSGLALAGLAADRLDPRFDYGGMVGLLARLGDDRLLVI